MYIGASPHSPTQDAMNGFIDDVRIYNRVLSATEVAQLAGINAAPVAGNDSPTTPYNTQVTINVRANDTDANGDSIAINSFTNGANGTVTQTAGGTLRYTPNSGFSGTDTFTYTVREPISCSEIRQMYPSAGDGVYTIFPSGQGFEVYCYGMSGNPTEYITLNKTGGPAVTWGINQDNTVSYNFSTLEANGPNFHQVSRFTKVRINPSTLKVISDDATFATVTREAGTNTPPFANIIACDNN